MLDWVAVQTHAQERLKCSDLRVNRKQTLKKQQLLLSCC